MTQIYDPWFPSILTLVLSMPPVRNCVSAIERRRRRCVISDTQAREGKSGCRLSCCYGSCATQSACARRHPMETGDGPLKGHRHKRAGLEGICRNATMDMTHYNTIIP